MSLILRDKCQQILDDAGYPNIHARIDSSKTMYLCSECGQPLLTIRGITFSKQAPTVLEMDLAAILLDTFITAHKTKIDAYLTAKAALITPSTLVDQFGDIIIGQYRGTKYVDQGNHVFIGDNNEVNTINYLKTPYTEFTLNIELFKNIQAALQIQTEYENDVMHVSNLQADLNKCDV